MPSGDALIRCVSCSEVRKLRDCYETDSHEMWCFSCTTMFAEKIDPDSRVCKVCGALLPRFAFPKGKGCTTCKVCWAARVRTDYARKRGHR